MEATQAVDIPVRIAKPVLRISDSKMIVPNGRLDMSEAVQRSPLKYSNVFRSSQALDRSLSPQHNTSILPPELIPAIPDDTFRHPKQVALPWIQHGLQRPHTVGGTRSPAFDKVYDPDNIVAGVASLEKSLRSSSRGRWRSTSSSPPTAAMMLSKPTAKDSHLGPGCYGEGGVPKVIGHRETISFPLPRSERFDDSLGSATDATYDTTQMPLPKRTNAHKDKSIVRSSVHRFAPLPGTDKDPSLSRILSHIPIANPAESLEEVLEKSPIKYAPAFKSKLKRIPDSTQQREINSRAKSRDAVYEGAYKVNTIEDTLHSPKNTRVVYTLRSTVELRPMTASATSTMGPGVYADGVNASVKHTRPKTAGETVLPQSSTMRFVDNIPAYKTLSSGTLVDDSALGHRPRSPEKFQTVRMKHGDGHTGMYKAKTSEAPDIVYNIDVAGSPVASISTRVAKSPLKYSRMGPGHPKPQRDDDGKLIPIPPPEPGRDTTFVNLEKTVTKMCKEMKITMPDAARTTVSGLPATFDALKSTTNSGSSFMKSSAAQDRGLTIFDAQRLAEERAKQRAERRLEMLQKRRSKQTRSHARLQSEDQHTIDTSDAQHAT